MNKRGSCSLFLISAITILLFFNNTVYAEGDKDWPMFMKDAVHLASTSSSIVPPLKLKWKFSIDSPIYSSPVVSDGRVFFGADDGKLYAIDIKTGKKLWEFQTGAEIIASPLVEEGVVYSGSRDGFLYALDSKTGKLLWKFATKGEITNSPMVDMSRAYVTSKDTYFYAVDKKTGKKKWRRHLNDYRYSGIYSNPAYRDGVVYVASKNMILYAYIAQSGARRGRYFLDSVPYSSPVIMDDKTLYIGTFDGSLYSIDMKLRKPKEKWKVDLGGWLYSSPVVNNDRILIGTMEGDLFALKTSDGSVVWKVKLDAPIHSTMSISADKIGYIGCDDGKLYAIDLANGKIVWSFTTFGGVHTAPAIADGMVIFGSKDGNLYALGK